ncbi:hypothetical protein CSUNSWCD_281 [Campylobacter showae CSUNSWCD]|uniref:Uncharacterized protein n=1 Tax=Campylobacter showae CSUNSWCD TaxID=1244083 RepID=M5ISB4_9BACT|nr:hypothetical protein CSUNSWCD_281 [Campylobacter showae CSUNSWCD]
MDKNLIYYGSVRCKTSRRAGQIWTNKFACERESIVCGR